jgi:hypothetical protein
MTDFHCAAIRHNIRFDTTTDSQVKILPCCVYKTNRHYQTLEQYYNSDEIQQLQSATDWPNGCTVCQRQEAQNQTSYRHHANNSLSNVSGVRYELMPSNVCNLKCVMCSPMYSTALAKERFTIGIESIDLSRENNTATQQLEILSQANNIESISIIGGEFFLTKGNLEIMDFVIVQQVPLRIVTNATVLLDSHLDRLKQIKDLELQISIDGYKEGYEIMRYPAKWDNFVENTSRLINQLPGADINFHFVVQALNIQQLIPTLDWCNRQRRSTRVTNLVQPEYLGWQIFSDVERSEIINLLQDQCKQYKITPSQKQLATGLCDTIANTKLNLKLRNQFESTVQQLYEHRWPALRGSNSHHMVRSHVFYPLN